MQFNFGNDVETFMLEHISEVVEIIGDGHCGYRSLAELLGWGEKEWVRVRRELVEELDRHRGLYDPICLLDTIDELQEQIDYYTSPAPPRHWIHMPHTGLIFATVYQVILVHLDLHEPVTCLPMIAPPGSSPPKTIFCIARLHSQQHYIVVSKQYFIVPFCFHITFFIFTLPYDMHKMKTCVDAQIWLDDNALLPSVITTWSYYHNASVAGWDTPLLHRIKQFTECRNVIRDHVPIVLDD
ncbi:unnamed protein product [Cuscuta epithymum]|uniref:OTU domain-containing protein n=1 Tax=Cuscuta epithymum TaxID=186058 RepID=A0AAV0FRK9_9ASTE|nr:unnamed protein product [Cuscuta epithymum]CAH9138288.1 unnamed protein product [Cuscuta epithymum]